MAAVRAALTAGAGELVADLLAGGVDVRVRVTGASMRPLLRGGETVTISPVPAAALRAGDLVLRRGADRALILHRVVGFSGTGAARAVVTRGDALAARDEPCRAGQILGRVSRVEGLRLAACPGALETRSAAWRVASRCCLTLSRARTLGGRARGRLSRLLRPGR